MDQERARVQDLRKQLSEARNIKQEIIERGQSANLKVDLLNDELEDARGRIGSLEKALVAAREAIRVLQRGGSGSSTVKVSLPSSSTAGLSSPRRETSLFTNPIGGGGNSRMSSLRSRTFDDGRLPTPPLFR